MAPNGWFNSCAIELDMALTVIDQIHLRHLETRLREAAPTASKPFRSGNHQGLEKNGGGVPITVSGAGSSWLRKSTSCQQEGRLP
jgi:hypothetical protein